MSQVTLNINGQTHTVDVPSDMPLLWALRDTLNLTGTKYSCGIGVCGTCTVLVNGTPMRSCAMPAISMAGVEITTIEGIAQGLYYSSKEFLEAGKRRLAGDTARAASTGEVKTLRREAHELKEVVAEQALELRLLKKSMIADGGDEE